MKREIDFQFSKFSCKDSIFYIEGMDTKTWFSVEDCPDYGDIVLLSDMMVKEVKEFITAGIFFSVEEKIPVNEILPVMLQSLYKPLTFDIMLQMITNQDRFTTAKWRAIYPGVLFLGSKLTVIKAKGWKNKAESIQQIVGQVYYPVMRFREYTRDYYGLWLPEVVREDSCNSNFTTAVTI